MKDSEIIIGVIALIGLGYLFLKNPKVTEKINNNQIIKKADLLKKGANGSNELKTTLDIQDIVNNSSQPRKVNNLPPIIGTASKVDEVQKTIGEPQNIQNDTLQPKKISYLKPIIGTASID